MMSTIESACKIMGALGIGLVGLSLMWAFLIAMTGHLPMPPVTLFAGLFAAFASGCFWIAAKLLLDGTLD